ncbi:MAG: hypothetical protein NW237_07625 [Cyanobacteriota bacterium]|nr:hypothetical protein [Cyanobacteriota bacterium]
MIEESLLAIAAILWGSLWGYSTLLIVLVLLQENKSLYAYPMRMALDRFVELLGFNWLKSLHQLQLTTLRLVSYGMFVIVSLGVSFLLLVLDP